MRGVRLLAVVAVVLSAVGAAAQDVLPLPDKAWVIGPIGRAGRNAIVQDALMHQIVTGTWRPPTEGATVARASGGERAWKQITLPANGSVGGDEMAGGYLYLCIKSPSERVAILEASGHSMAILNGDPRGGDPYGFGWLKAPVQLKQGDNHLLLQGARGQVRVALRSPAAPAYVDGADPTLPDLVAGKRGKHLGAALVINATDHWLRGAVLRASGAGLSSTQHAVPPVPPFSSRKVPFDIAWNGSGSGSVKVSVRLEGGPKPSVPCEFGLRVRTPAQTRKITFVSEIDGSVQYYALNPSTPQPARSNPRQALVLSLHGASVEGLGQADSYASKTWANLAAPTNRRPYGFDWEEWGRLDAMEVLRLATSEVKPDPSRIYLTGHSMGGHGTWINGVTYPDRFAAIAPSAGWVSFVSYGGGSRFYNPSPVEEMLRRASAEGDTLALATNLRDLGVYILHGDADDNVPVTEARRMAQELSGFHKDYTLYEQPGAGHWWGAASDPGAGCVDWPAIFDLFARRSIPAAETVRSVDFTTMNPETSSRMRWLTIEQAQRQMLPARARIRRDPAVRRFVGTTENIRRMTLDLGGMAPGEKVTLDLDGGKQEVVVAAGAAVLALEKGPGGWSQAGPLPADAKGPARCGPFRHAWNHRFVLVYGTKGTAEENAWAFARARFDVETWWYRGNGAVDMMPDTEFRADRDRDRSVVLYGNADTNAAWPALLAASPMQVRRGSAALEGRTWSGEELACLFMRPRPGSAVASVAVVGGTGLAGMRLTGRAPIFVSGAGLPDLLLWSAESLLKGVAGVRAAGFFGNDWSVGGGEFAYQ